MGALVGRLASLAMQTNAQMGAIANIVAGIVASSLGSGWPARADCPPATLIEGWVIAVLGATLLILLLKVVGIYK